MDCFAALAMTLLVLGQARHDDISQIKYCLAMISPSLPLSAMNS
jgi:hypothetical protein